MKKLIIVLGGLFLITVVAMIVLIAKLGTIVKTAVNKVGPAITQTTFVLKDADISPFSGKGSLKELTIGNPKGWSTEHAFFLKEVSIDLVPNSVWSGDHIVINSIVIDNPEIVYETTITNSNLQDLIKNIQQSTGGSGQPAATETKPESKPETAAQPAAAEPAKEPKIEIKSFRLANVTVKGTAAGKSYTVTLPEFVMTDIGTKEGGLTPQELSVAILKELSIRVGKAAAVEAGKRGLLDKAGEGLRDLLGGKK